MSQNLFASGVGAPITKLTRPYILLPPIYTQALNEPLRAWGSNTPCLNMVTDRELVPEKKCRRYDTTEPVDTEQGQSRKGFYPYSSMTVSHNIMNGDCNIMIPWSLLCNIRTTPPECKIIIPTVKF